MLSHKFYPHFLYAIDDATSALPDTSQDKKEETGDSVKLHTSEEVSKIASSEAKKAKAKAEAAYLERLGVSSLDEAVSKLALIREKEEAEKSETQKLSDKLAEMQKALDAEKQARSQAEQLRLEEKRDNALKSLLSNAHDPEGALLLLKAKYGTKVAQLLNEAGEFDTTEANKLIAEYKAANAYQFKGDGKGSPSNAEGRLLKPDAEVRKDLEQEIRRKLRF